MQLNKLELAAIILVSIICLLCLILTSWFVYNKFLIAIHHDDGDENENPEDINRDYSV